MATFVRRVLISLCIFVILAVKNCQAQIVGGDFNKDNAHLQGHQNVLNQRQNAIPNAGGNPVPPAAGNFGQQQGQPQFQQQQQQFQQPAFHGAINAAKVGAQNVPGGMKFVPGNLRTLMLAEHPDCAEDVLRICSKTMTKNNFAVLDCLQDAAAEVCILYLKEQSFRYF